MPALRDCLTSTSHSATRQSINAGW
jgi:hypothetical protein